MPSKETGHPTFSDEHLARFEAAYPEGTRERLAYSVLLYTGLRIGDAARLGCQHVQKDGAIKLRTEKTGADVVIGIVPPLARAFVAGPTAGFSLQVLWLRMLRRPRPLNVARCPSAGPNISTIKLLLFLFMTRSEVRSHTIIERPFDSGAPRPAAVRTVK